MSTQPTKNKVQKSDSVDSVVPETISAALEELNLDSIDSPDVPVKIIETASVDVRTGPVDLNNMPSQMFHQQPHMMGMGFVPYSQMMHMPHQPGFYPPPDFPESQMQMGNPGPIMFNHSGDFSGFPNPPNMLSPMNGGPSFANGGIGGSNPNGPFNNLNPNDPLWPNNEGNNQKTVGLDDSAAANGETGASNVACRRQTFHAISTNELVDKNDDASKATIEKKDTLESSSSNLGVMSSVGAKNRTQSTSIQKSDRDTLFATPNSTEITNGKTKKVGGIDGSKPKDMNNLQTYAAAYPYGGPLLQHTGMMPDNPMPHSPFTSGYEFGAPFQSFSPVLGGPTPPMPGQSPIRHISPSPIQMGPPGSDPLLNNPGMRKGQDDMSNGANLPLPQHFPMIQHQQNGSPPPWLYNGPPFNGMVPQMNGPHNPHNGMNMLGSNNNGRGHGRLGNGRNGHFNGKNKFGKNGYHNYNYGNNNPNYNQSKMEEASRYADATLDQFIGNIYSLCKDQHGCRFLQKQLDVLGMEASDAIFEEVKEYTIELMVDSFGNYLIQKLIENVTVEQRIELSKIAAPKVVDIALNPHGTRALQKLIECINTDEEAQIVVNALKDSVVELSKDLNGNHVIQKCLQKLEPENFQFVFDAMNDECFGIATHRHGCCVLQRCLDHGTKDQCKILCDRLLTSLNKLVLDPYGNYVIQYIINRETDKNDFGYTHKIVRVIKPKIIELSVHKFGSNVIEKLLRTPIIAESMILELINNKGESDIQLLLNDSYGNYVLQTALDVSHNQNESTYNKLSAIVSPLLVGPIRNTPHGKRIITMLHLEEQ